MTDGLVLRISPPNQIRESSWAVAYTETVRFVILRRKRRQLKITRGGRSLARGEKYEQLSTNPEGFLEQAHERGTACACNDGSGSACMAA
jgi:hypothetical protein